MGPEALAHVLRPLQELFRAERFPDLIVGLESSDDAAVYRVSGELGVIQTLDFFSPVVDDPYDYGAIAAANAMSDVYAVGGEVVLALNICAFPSALPPGIVADILRGGAEKVMEAGAVVAGGHTVDDREPKYGLAVMGLVHPDRILTKGGARPGDALVLTKPLGVGIITTAAKGDAAQPGHLAAAVESMKRLNRTAARAAQHVGVHACTDITGFGLLGHAAEMAERSAAGLRFTLARLPFLDGAATYAERSLFPGGACRNEDFFSPHLHFDDAIPAATRRLLCTPETSGGLLLAVPPDRAQALVAACAAAGQQCWIVGECEDGAGIRIVAA